MKSINRAGLQCYSLSLSRFGAVRDTLDTGLRTGRTYSHAKLSTSAPAEDNIGCEQNNCGLHELVSNPRKILDSRQELYSDGETRKSWRNTEAEPQELRGRTGRAKQRLFLVERDK